MEFGSRINLESLLTSHQIFFRSGKVLSRVPSSGPKEVSRAVEAARAAFKEWSAMTGMERGRTLCKAAEKVRVHAVWFIRATFNILMPRHFD